MEEIKNGGQVGWMTWFPQRWRCKVKKERRREDDEGEDWAADKCMEC